MSKIISETFLDIKYVQFLCCKLDTRDKSPCYNLSPKFTFSNSQKNICKQENNYKIECKALECVDSK